MEIKKLYSLKIKWFENTLYIFLKKQIDLKNTTSDMKIIISILKEKLHYVK